MGDRVWERFFDQLALDPNHREPIPVRRLHRVETPEPQPPLTPRSPRRPSLELSRIRSERSLKSTTSTVRSFHRPFYAESAHSPSFPRPRSNTTDSSSIHLTSTIPYHPKLPTTPSTPEFCTRTSLRNPSSASSISTNDTISTPDNVSAFFHDHHGFTSCDLPTTGEHEVEVISPDDWITRFYSEPPKVPSSADKTDDCPDLATLAAVRDIPIYNANGESVPFGHLYDPALAPDHASLYPRQLVIFIRHFHCGACQAYVRALTEQISVPDYFGIPVPTSFVVVGCGRPSMIRYYRRVTRCPWPIYAEPSRRLFRKLGMGPTLDMGAHTHPEYLTEVGGVGAMWSRSLARIAKEYVDHEAGQLSGWDCVKGGNIFQVGGEFLFEGGQVVWCHRMKHWRGHAEVGVLRKLLDMDV